MTPTGAPPPPSTPAQPTRVRRRYHLGVPGGVYIFVTLLIALGAFNSQNNLLFWAFGFALSLLMISGILSGAMLMGIEIVREPPSPVVEGEVGALHYRVRNRNRFIPAFALTVVEVPRATPRIRRQRAAPPRISEVRCFVPHVPAMRAVVGGGPVRAARRGPAPLDSILVSTSFPFGIIKKSLLFEQPDEVLVHPSLVPLPHGFVNSALRSGDRGQAPTRRAGAGDDFFSLREYQPGDPLRDISWRASARRDELLVRQTAAPAPMRLQVLLSFAGSPGEEADERAIRLAAAAADSALARSLAVGLRILGSETELRPRDGRMQRELVMDALARLDPAAVREHDHRTPLERDAESRQLRSPGVLVVVHAGEPDTSFTPAWAIHLTAAGADAVPTQSFERLPARA